MFQLLRNRTFFIFGSLFFLAICFYCGEAYPRVWPDEVLFFSPSYNLYKYNILRTEVLKGLIPGMGTHTLWMPPLFFYFQAFLFHFLPAKLEFTRMGAAFLGVLSIFFFSEIAREYGVTKKYRIALKLLLLTDFLFFKISHSARMESLCTLFAILSIYFLTYKMSQGKSVSRLRILFAGSCFGLSFLSHPFGLAYLPINIFLLYQRGSLNLKNLLYLVLGTLSVIWIWLIYILPNFELFKIQFGAQLGRKKELFGFFTLVKKFKIIFSEFRYPTYKTILFLISISCFIYVGIVTKVYKNLKQSLFNNSLFVFSFVYVFTILCFLIISSESWYVYHFIFPLSLLIVALPFEKSNYYTNSPLVLSLIYNFFVYASFVYLNIISIDMKKLTEVYYKQIDSIIEGSASIYLQAIPDPYFHFRRTKPNLDVYEFIPGELPIEEDYYKDKIISFDAYIFYEPSLMNHVIKDFFDKNPNSFHKEEIYIQTPKRADFTLKATVYIKKVIFEESKKKAHH